MTSEFRTDQTDNHMAYSQASNAQFANLWNLHDIQALNSREQIAQLPTDFSSPSRAAGVIARDAGGSTSSITEREHALFGNGFSFDQMPNAYGDNKPVLAQDLQYPILPTLVPSPGQLGITPETAKALAKAASQVIEPWTKDHPLADQENEVMAATTASDPHAWQDAKNAFPQLASVPVDIMQAYTRNEIANYDRFDLKDDIDAASNKITDLPNRPAEQATLGISQISPKGVRELEARYPQLKHFLESKGYTGSQHEIAALLDPECAPMIVAAKTASIVEDMQKHGIKNPTAEQIAYAYNPDVYSYSDGHGGRVYQTLHHPQIELSKALHPDQRKEYYASDPRVISASEHIHNVISQLQRSH